MKIIFLAIFINLFCGFATFAQNSIEINDSLQNTELDLSFLDSIKIPAVEIKREKEEEEIVFCHFDGSIATFEGGMDNFYNVIRENLRFPEEGKAGRVFIKFVIDTTGKMTDFEIMESPSEQNSSEVLRMMNVINEKYSWKPATSRGKKIKARMAIPIKFYLDKKKKPNTEKIYRR